MPHKRQVLLVSRSIDAAERIHACFEAADEFEVDKRIMNGQADPLSGILTAPDLLVLRVAPDSQLELEALAGYAPDSRPPLIVIGDTNHAPSMRAAMQAGARDFLSEPVIREDLLAAVKRLTLEVRSPQKVDTSEVTVFINAKGGSGASFLAANIAHLLAEVSNRQTVLVDLDLQLGNLPQYFDLKPKRGLAEALDAANDLDSVAIDAYLARHASGLAVLAAQNIGVDLHHDLESFETVVDLLMDKFERVIVDVPRHVEPFSALMLERANKIVLVLQQSVPSLHDAVRMYEILTKDLAIPVDRIAVVVNRFHKTASIRLTDIEQSLNGRRPVPVPNDFQTVSESVDVGVPMYDYARRSPVTKALLQLEELIDGRPAATPKGLIARLRGATG